MARDPATRDARSRDLNRLLIRAGLPLRAAEFPALRGDLRPCRARTQCEAPPHARQFWKVVVRAKGHLPHVAGASIHSVPAQGLVRAGGIAFPDDDEARISRDEIRPQIHAVHFDMRIAGINLIVARHQNHNAPCLAGGKTMRRGRAR